MSNKSNFKCNCSDGRLGRRVVAGHTQTTKYVLKCSVVRRVALASTLPRQTTEHTAASSLFRRRPGRRQFLLHHGNQQGNQYGNQHGEAEAMNASIPSDISSSGKKQLLPEAQAAAETVLYGVTGWPLAQSLSPLLHNTGFKTLGLPALYLRWEIAPPHLPAFVDSVRTLRIGGCSVTIPHKVALLPLLDKVSPLARQVGAVNTIYWQDGQLCGENTDVAGFMAPLAHEDLHGVNVLLLGAGGAARAAAAGLMHLAQDRRPGNVFICTPSDATHLPLAEEFGLTPVPWAQRHDIPARLVVNTTPLGMRGKAEDETPYYFDLADKNDGENVAKAASFAYDIVYNPLETLFLRDAARHGRRCLSGMDMFFGQGDAQFRLWTGQSLPLESRRALEATLNSG